MDDFDEDSFMPYGQDDDPLLPTNFVPPVSDHEILQGQLSGSVQGHISLNGAQSMQHVQLREEKRRTDNHVLATDLLQHTTQAFVQAIMGHIVEAIDELEEIIEENDDQIEVLDEEQEVLTDVIDDMEAGEDVTTFEFEFDAETGVLDVNEVLVDEEAEAIVQDFEEENNVTIDRDDCDEVEQVLEASEAEEAGLQATNLTLRAELEGLQNLLDQPELLEAYVTDLLPRLPPEAQERILAGEFDDLDLGTLKDDIELFQSRSSETLEVAAVSHDPALPCPTMG